MRSYLNTIFMAPACARVDAVAVVETLHLGDIQGGEDGVTGEGYAGVHGGHYPLRGVDGKAGSATLNILRHLTCFGVMLTAHSCTLKRHLVFSLKIIRWRVGEKTKRSLPFSIPNPP